MTAVEVALPESIAVAEAATAAPPARPKAGPSELDRSFVKSTAWIGAAKWLSQMVAWGCTIVVARILTPEDYGIVGMANIFLGLVTLMSEFGIGEAVVTLRNVDRSQIRQLNTFAVAMGILCFLITCAAAFPLSWLFNAPELVAVVAVLGSGFVAAGFRTVPDGLLQKDLEFRRMAIFEAAQAFATAGAVMCFALLGFGYWTLVLSALLGGVMSTVLSMRLRPCGFEWPRIASIRDWLGFGRQLLVTRLAWYTYSNADFLIVGKMLGQRMLGFYNIAWSLSSVPVSKISSIVARVGPAYFSAAQKDPALLRRYLLSVTEGLSILTFPCAVGLALTAEHFVLLALGEKWLSAVAPLQLLALYASLRSISPMVPQVLTVTGEAQFNMRNAILAAFVLPFAFWFASRWGVIGVATAWMIAHPMVLLPVYVRAFRKIDLRARDYLVALMPALAGCAGMVVTVLATRYATVGLPLPARFTLEVGSGGLAYVAVIRLLFNDRIIAFRALIGR